MKSIILLSGGLDSAVLLALAKHKGRDCIALSFDYGQRHRLELRAAKNIAKFYGASHRIIKIDYQSFGNSSLVSGIPVPKNSDLNAQEIPSTYVPARNTLFIAFTLAQAELQGAEEIYFGANKDDHIAYPDCRPEYFAAYQTLINVATKQSVETKPPELVTPLLDKTKAEIVAFGNELKVPYHLTLSCYDPTPLGEHCGSCLSCEIRKKAFASI